jgi:type II secretory ATPase GspE/PulE/Tfp pilus assembly ATPase PilB-like protein
MFSRKKKTLESATPGDMGPPVLFKAAGGDRNENEANLIKVRQSPGIITAKELFFNVIEKQSRRILLDFTRQAVAGGFDVDGIMHRIAPMDPSTGDTMLAVLKTLANLNVRERRARQDGGFSVRLEKEQLDCTLTSQGTKTGERVLIKLEPKERLHKNLADLGMREKTVAHFKTLVGRPLEDEIPPPVKGLFILSAPANGGLSTIWRVGLEVTDRYMNSCVCIDSETPTEPEVENVKAVSFDPRKPEELKGIMTKLFREQHDMYLFPRMPNREILDVMCQQIVDEEIVVFIGVQANDSAEALLRIKSLNPNPENFSQAVTAVLNMRLVRRLCEHCKQSYRPNPALLQKLRVPPDRVSTLYREWQPPPPDEEPKRKKGEPEVCPNCNGVGYRGRLGLFDLLEVNDQIRKALVQQPQLELIRQLAQRAGSHTLQEEGILALVQGLTTIKELQRAMKS